MIERFSGSPLISWRAIMGSACYTGTVPVMVINGHFGRDLHVRKVELDGEKTATLDTAVMIQSELNASSAMSHAGCIGFLDVVILPEVKMSGQVLHIHHEIHITRATRGVIRWVIIARVWVEYVQNPKSIEMKTHARENVLLTTPTCDIMTCSTFLPPLLAAFPLLENLNFAITGTSGSLLPEVDACLIDQIHQKSQQGTGQ
ncbi:hypothetical protein DEU56DRAFT_760086 [Suillus clintonianus]|uniref:uncharacterized protein n=1 Tax=Suillus clintonianus TaxID=1904413 RepID=UPI001B869F87|nr:uncharacterized protein DEU56DRAFT_760086 [Suillus clintonianus]KAG2123272.1 hypothetical protein DEU56DRAFT_760086 [Suillus clintonianus]